MNCLNARSRGASKPARFALRAAPTVKARSARPDLLAMHAAIDSLLKYLLRFICTQLAGESAGGTLWLRDKAQQGFRLHSVLRNGRLLSPKAMRRVCVPGLQLLTNELPGSGTPALSSERKMEQSLSRDVRGFVSLPMTLDRGLLGCFVIWLKPTDASPTPDQMRAAASLTELALLALQAPRLRRRSI
jgi:hypothetical protein